MTHVFFINTTMMNRYLLRILLIPVCLIFGKQTLSSADYELYHGQTCTFVLDETELPVVQTAMQLLKRDLDNVLSVLLKKTPDVMAAQLIVGTRGSSRYISENDIRWEELEGKKQAFCLKVHNDGKLYIVGSDEYGTAYGVMELSRLLGVSPWEWWADVHPMQQQSFVLDEDFGVFMEPDVEYRGIFINDEDWGLLPWSNTNYEPSENKSHIGPRTHERIFELLLRLRANTFWPAMHECTQPFFMTEGNREVAARYGIYIGSSHCEPMACNAAGEWSRRGTGDYDYVNNASEVHRFWEQRVKEVADQQILYTLGMRGVHDGKMQGAKTIDEQKEVLSRVINDQRELLRTYVNKEVEKVPQVFIPYKEVLDIYNAGLQVPEDVTLMWCDDNYGYIRHFPTNEERAREGGNGIYYHVSYWGRPHDYLWLCTQSPYLMHHQMKTAYDSGIQKMWILNVGDLKPAEYHIELFMDMAWDIESVNSIGVTSHMRAFLSREFGTMVSEAATPLMVEHYHWAYRRKPEFMAGTRTEERDAVWKQVHDLPLTEDEIKERINVYQYLSDEVEALSMRIPASRSTAFYHLVKYPIQGAAQMNFKYLKAQLSGRDMLSIDESNMAHDSILSLTRRYNDSKWNGIMDWRPRRLPVFNRLPDEVVSCKSDLDSMKCLFTMGANQTVEKVSSVWSELGYSRNAVSIDQDDVVSYTFTANQEEAVVELQFVPTHPLVGSHLRVALSVDGSDEQIVSYETKGRSEEWKENVLVNLAKRRVPVRLSTNSDTHTMTLRAIDKGVLFDRFSLLVKTKHN